MAECPEHEKLALIKDKSQACGEFLEWLQEKGFVLAKPHKHEGDCYDPDSGESMCSLGDMLFPESLNIPVLLAEYFEIDLEKIDKEKRAMIEELRARRA